MYFIKTGERIKYYRDLLHLTQKDLARGRLSLKMIYLLENNKKKLTPVTASILVYNFHEIANEKGILINLEIKDLLMSDNEYAKVLCDKKLNELDSHNYDEAEYFEIIELAKQYDLNKPLYKAYEKMSSYHYNNKSYSLALKYLEELLSMCSILPNKDEEVSIINKSGTCCYMLNNYDKAIFYYKLAYNKFLEYGIVDFKLEDKLLYNLALCNLVMENYKDALMYIDNLEKVSNIDESELYINLILKANIFMKINRIEEALNIYKDVLNHDIKYLYIVQNNMAVAFMHLGRLKESIEFFIKSINNQLNRLSPDTTTSLIKLAEVYHREEKYEEAFIFYGYGFDNAKKFMQVDNILQCYENIFSVCKGMAKISKFDFYFQSMKDLYNYFSFDEEHFAIINSIDHNYISIINN